jgi:hypothetical protein
VPVFWVWGKSEKEALDTCARAVEYHRNSPVSFKIIPQTVSE